MPRRCDGDQTGHAVVAAAEAVAVDQAQHPPPQQEPPEDGPAAIGNVLPTPTDARAISDGSLATSVRPQAHAISASASVNGRSASNVAPQARQR